MEIMTEEQNISGKDVTLAGLNTSENWKILVVDDEKDIHSLTSLLLKNLEFNNKGFLIFDAYTADEAKKIIKGNPDIQLVLLDVVMETPDAGLEFVKYVREELKNDFTRIVIRTGQPGQAPQAEVFQKYDINNYANKTELTADSFSMLILSELKNYYKIIESKDEDNFIYEKDFLRKENRQLATEISEHIQIEELLKESEERFKSLLDTAVGWEYWITEKGEIKYSSPSCFEITGYRAEDIISGKIRCEEIIHPDDRELFRKHRDEESLLTENLTREFKIIDKSGKAKHLLHTCQPVYDNDGNFVGRRASNHDITLQKKQENIIRQSEEKFKKLNKSKNQLFSIIAHDLRSPFLSILGFTELLTEEIRKIKDEDLHSITNNISSSVRKVYELLENLLTWSRLQNNQIHFNPKCISVHHLTEKIIELYKLQTIDKNIKITNNLNGNKMVFADYFMTDTILRNLINNAIKFTQPDGTIIISSETVDKFEKICVEDNGIGIPEENQKKLFTSFEVHSQTAINKESGSGIGLLLCKEFVETNKGKIFIESNPGKGSKFYFTLPLKNSHTNLDLL